MRLTTDPALDAPLRALAVRRDYLTPQGKLDVSRMVSDHLRDLLKREGLLLAKRSARRKLP